MNIINIEILGFIAGIIITTAHIPQIMKSVRTKLTHDISLTLYCMIWIGMALWMTYGYYKDALAVFVMNCISITAISIMIYLKLRYGMDKVKKIDPVDW